MKYDCRNRLVSAGGISYEYDAENNRISQTENGAKTEYVVDSNSSSLTRILTAEKEGDTTYYIYGIGLIAQENGNEYLIYHFNNIGSTEAVTNIDGEIVETFDYGPYGELLSENKCGIMFLYNGELGVATDSNGLYYMRARYYNPEIKRFINQDVMTGSIANTPTLNRYAYVNGNPISLNDPFGLSPFLNWLDGITGHDILDLLGMLPGIGFVFDGINAAWYAQEGDYYNAACSLVSALPGAGDALGVFAKTGKSCKLVTAFHKTGSAGNLMIGSYELGKTADKYISGDASFTWEEIKGDLFKVAMTGTSMWGSAKDFGTSYCFVAGTLVTTEDGQEPIEEIEVGDKVLSEDETTGEVAVKTVTETYINETDELIHICVNGETISATPTHPFYVDKLGWTLARSLRAGDVLVLSNGELVTVEWVQHEILESPIKVYNFEVQDFHTYFVGENGVFVHNGCGDNQSVYALYDENTNQIEYVGRTNDLEKRKAQHKASNSSRKNLKMVPIAEDIPYDAARGLEQLGIEKYNTLNPVKKSGNAYNNQINGVSKSAKNATKSKRYLTAGEEYANKLDESLNDYGLHGRI